MNSCQAFVAIKSKYPYSGMAIDQAHEQENTGISDDVSALWRRMVAGPEVGRLVVEYESLADAKDANERVRHLEQTERAQRAFFEKVLKLYSTLIEIARDK